MFTVDFIPDSTIEIETEDRNAEGRVRFRYTITAPDWEYVGNDLQSGASAIGGSEREGMSALLSFLAADAEAYMAGYRDDFAFPIHVVEWAYQNSDEIAIAQVEIDG